MTTWPHLILVYVWSKRELAKIWCFSPVSSSHETDCHDITEILLKVALNTITLTQKPFLITRHNLTKGYSYHYIYNDDSYHCKNIKCLHCHSFCILKKKKKIFERQYKWFPFTYLRDVFSASNLDASNNKATTLE